MKNIFYLIVVISGLSCGTKSSYVTDLEIKRVAKNAGFVNPSETPLDVEELKTFKGIFFFPVDEKYKVTAMLVPSPDMPVFDMPHTNGRTYSYRKFGDVKFTLEGRNFSFPVYTNEELNKQHLLFFAFTDLTNGKETYEGGKYIDVAYDGKTTNVILDFNQSYFPYCAYSHRFSCPIVSKENQIDFEIKAGEKFR